MLSIQSLIEQIFIAHVPCIRSRAGHLEHKADSSPSFLEELMVPGPRLHPPISGSSLQPSLLVLDLTFSLKASLPSLLRTHPRDRLSLSAATPLY